MANPKGSLHRLIDQSSLGSADSLASLSKTEEETCAQDELWANMSPPLNRYPSYTDIQVTPSPGQQTVSLSSPQGEAAADEALQPQNGNQSHSDAPPAHSFAQQRTINVQSEERSSQDHAEHRRPQIAPDFGMVETPAAPRTIFPGGDAFAALETVARLLRDASEKQARAEEEVNEWREKFERERQRAVAAEGRVTVLNAQLPAGDSPRFESSHEPSEAPEARPLTPVSDKRMAPCTSNHQPGAQPSIAREDGRMAPGGPCSCSYEMDVCGRRVLRSGIPEEKDRASNGGANDGRHGPDASWRDAGDSWRIADGGTRKAEVKEDGEKRDGMRCPPRKAHFKLAWRSADGVETTHRHRHEIVSYERGNISNMARSNKQVALVWETPPQAVLIVRKPNSSRVSKMVQEVVRWLTNVKKLTVVLEPASYRELIDGGGSSLRVETWEEEEELLYMHQRVDLVVTLGGDGTVLWASSLFKGPVPPVVSFAMGSLGFLTPFPIEGYQDCLSSLLKGPIYLTLRNRIQCRVIENGANEAIISPRPTPAFERLVLNEVAIDRGMSSFLTNLECYCDGDSMTTVQGDGLIVSTPSGSTAYSLSAGGSMVHPQVPGILFTPICPHSLSFRPLILPEYVCLRVQVPFETRGQAWASFDGRDRRQLCPGDALILEMSHWPVPAACHEDATQDFLNSARQNLHWNLRKLQE